VSVWKRHVTVHVSASRLSRKVVHVMLICHTLYPQTVVTVVTVVTAVTLVTRSGDSGDSGDRGDGGDSGDSGDSGGRGDSMWQG
jgi:uncharacterized membrane protein YgcG